MATTVSGGRRVEFERPRSTEAADIEEIVPGILTLQARFAEREHGPLERGTHAKGICARATFEVFDVRHVVARPALAARLARGLFAQPGTYPATVRFANASGQVRSDSVRDVRALSFAVDVPAGVVGPTATRLDFSMNNAPTFPINDAHAFAAFMRVLSAGGAWASLRALWSLSVRGPARDRPHRRARRAADATRPCARTRRSDTGARCRSCTAGRSDEVLGHPVARQSRASRSAPARTCLRDELAAPRARGCAR